MAREVTVSFFLKEFVRIDQRTNLKIRILMWKEGQENLTHTGNKEVKKMSEKRKIRCLRCLTEKYSPPSILLISPEFGDVKIASSISTPSIVDFDTRRGIAKNS